VQNYLFDIGEDSEYTGAIQIAEVQTCVVLGITAPEKLLFRRRGEGKNAWSCTSTPYALMA
jgi:hypothetical protein